jgi:cytochrome b561
MWLHLGLAVFGIGAFLSGELAEHDQGTGYWLHAYLGLSLSALIAGRIVLGFTTNTPLSFKGWSPFSRRQWQLALEDFRALLSLKVPHRERHQGLAGLTQALGLMLFAWMGLSGSGLFVLGREAEYLLFKIIEELHEVGESLIPLYLALHIGAVVLHSLAGKPVWPHMFRFKQR